VAEKKNFEESKSGQHFCFYVPDGDSDKSTAKP
jgi:hypothetical protein